MHVIKNGQQIRPMALSALTISFFLFICWIIIQADRGESSALFVNLKKFPFGDKVGHFILYGILAFLVNLSMNNKRIKLFSRSVLLGSLWVGIFAVLEEFTQIGLASRNFEWFDILCDLMGISLFSYLAVWLGKRIKTPRPVR